MDDDEPLRSGRVVFACTLGFELFILRRFGSRTSEDGVELGALQVQSFDGESS